MQEIHATKIFFCLTLDKSRKKCISILLYFFRGLKNFYYFCTPKKTIQKNEIEHL